MTPRRFWLGLAGLVALGLGVRLGYGFLVAAPPRGDALWYHGAANGLADGDGFRSPSGGWKTAFHPPLFPVVLAAVSKLGGTGVDAHQATGCVLGAGAVAAIGVLGRRVAGDAAGLAAAGLAAVYLPLVSSDSVGMSESLFVLLVPLVLLLALRLHERPTWQRALALGLVIGLAALTRTEALLLTAFVGAPVAFWLDARRLRTFALVCAGVVIVVTPWCVRNSLLWDRPVGTVTGDGSIVAGANCPTAYSGRLIGQWDFACLNRGVPSGLQPDEPAASDRWREEGIEYAGDHAGRVPLVLAVRVLRTWNLYDPRVQARVASAELGTPLWLEWLTIASALLAIGLAAAGIVLLRKRPRELTVLLAPAAMVTMTSLIGYGQPRFRAGADVVIVTLAGVAIAALLDRLGAHRGTEAAEAPA